MPTSDICVVNSSGVWRKISKLLAHFYQYKKQITGNMDPLPRVSVDTTHPALTAHVGKAGGRCVIPPQPANPLLVGRSVYPSPLVVLDWLVAVPLWGVLVLPLLVALDWQVLVGVC